VAGVPPPSLVLHCATYGRTERMMLMQALSNNYVFWILLFLVVVVVYLLPTLIGMIRGVDRLALVFLVNLIGAPTQGSGKVG
jgi:hypothetical protein